MERQRKSRNSILDQCLITAHENYASSAGSLLLLGRDSHKSAFDALSLSPDGCDGVLLPCELDSSFQVSLGVTIHTIQKAIDIYGTRVSIFNYQFFIQHTKF